MTQEAENIFFDQCGKFHFLVLVPHLCHQIVAKLVEKSCTRNENLGITLDNSVIGELWVALTCVDRDLDMCCAMKTPHDIPLEILSKQLLQQTITYMYVSFLG